MSNEETTETPVDEATPTPRSVELPPPPPTEPAPPSQKSEPLVCIDVSQPLDPSAAGDYVLKFCNAYVPCNYGDEKFKYVAPQFEQGFGTCCGFLPHAALWAAGCRMKFINRDDPPCKYINGWNITKIWNAGNPPFKRYVRGTTPPKGAILYISNGPPNTEHVLIFDHASKDAQGRTWWHTWDGGQTNTDEGPGKGKQCMRPKMRLVDGRTLGGRGIMGWVDPADLQYTAPPKDIPGIDPCRLSWEEDDGSNIAS